MQRETFAPDLEQILAPIPGGEPSGLSVRYDPAFLALRQSREEDDPTLPMREWERPLRVADWRAVAQDSIALLGRSKDLQLAAWLCDAWVRQHQIQGVNAGADVLLGLVERFWDGLHPPIDDGDVEARIAPFVWLNESLTHTLRLQVPLLLMPDRRPANLNLADWEQIVVTSKRAEGDTTFTREQLLVLVDSTNMRWLSDLRVDLEIALPKWNQLARALDDRLAQDAPSLAKVIDVLGKLQRACVSLLDGRDPREAPPPPAPAAAPEPATQNDEEPAMTAAASPEPAAAPVEQAISLPTGAINSRQDAYRMLEAAAAYLQRTEPHSPTPYLVKRAVTWGQMSLADLMQEILREEGDLTRYFSLLGLNQPRD